MLYTVAEISELINLSKVSVYNKLKLKELENHIIKKGGITYVDDEGLNLIKDSLKFKESTLNDLNNDNEYNEETHEITADIDDFELKEDYIKYLKSENERLWSELQEKNLQINELNKLLSNEQDLHKNSQILLKNEQYKQESLLELEAHFKELDNKLIDTVHKMEERKQQQENKGIFNFFKKK